MVPFDVASGACLYMTLPQVYASEIYVDEYTLP